MKKKIINLLKNISLLCGTTVVCILILEAVVRIFVSDLPIEPHPKNLYINDPDIGFVLNPGFSTVIENDIGRAEIRINSQSLRDNRDYGEKAQGTYRILLTGDSQTFNGAVPLDLTFGKLLEKHLNDKYEDVNFEVLNAGVPGYNNGNQLAFLEKFGKSFDPDMVLLGFYYNDILTNNTGTSTIEIRDGYMISENENLTPFRLPYPVKRFLRLHSHLYFYVMWKVAVFSRSKVVPWVELFSLSPEKDFSDNWAITEEYIQKINTWTAENNTELVLLYIPQKEQIDNSLWSEVSSDGREYDRHLPNSKMQSFCEDSGIHFLDLYSIFIDRHREKALYGEIDKHLSWNGNEVAGKAIFEYLENKGIIADKK
ncbi:SGNH/GDSL hydrolase family protein [candidate division KSB1 bacterium]